MTDQLENLSEENSKFDDIDFEGELSSEDLVEKVVLYAFDQAQQKLEQGGFVEPFTILIEGDNLKIENHTGEDAAECFESARLSIYAMYKLISAYVFCYDGYVELDDETRDALIVEYASKGDESGEALALLYTEDGDTLIFEESLYSLGEAPTFFSSKKITADQLEEI